MAKTTQLVNDDLADMLALIEGADSVELKLTVPESSQRSIVRALNLDPLDAQIRQVFFFDTPDLALNKVGVVAPPGASRGRVTTPSSSCARSSPPISPLSCGPPRTWWSRSTPCPAATSARRPTSASGATNARSDRHPWRGTAAQALQQAPARLLRAHAPEGITLDDLHVLGPIFVLKLRFFPADYTRGKIVAELWLYPDGSRILELSTKCAPADAIATALDIRAFLKRQGVDLEGDQQTKTKTALEFFAGELAEQA